MSKPELVDDVKKQKRDNGQGSICQRKDGRWVAKIQIGVNDNGKPNIKSVYGSSAAQAKRKLKQYKADHVKNNSIDIRKGTVATYLLDWLNNVKVYQVKQSSFDKFEGNIKNLINPSIGNVQMASINSRDIQNLINLLYTKKYSYSTINQIYHIIKECFSLGIIKQEIPFNPTLGVVLPKKFLVKNQDLKFLNEDEVKLVLNESKRLHNNGNSVYRLGEAITILLSTGMRIGELCALEWKDVDIANKTIYVHQTLSRVKNRKSTGDGDKFELIITTPKSKNSIRKIPLNSQSITAFQSIFNKTGTFDFVIVNHKGEHMIPSSISLFYRKILIHVGIEQRGIHSLRHTFASILFKKGVDPKTVSVILGHSDVSITYNTYIHLIHEQKAEAIDLIDF